MFLISPQGGVAGLTLAVADYSFLLAVNQARCRDEWTEGRRYLGLVNLTRSKINNQKDTTPPALTA